MIGLITANELTIYKTNSMFNQMGSIKMAVPESSLMTWCFRAFTDHFIIPVNDLYGCPTPSLWTGEDVVTSIEYGVHNHRLFALDAELNFKIFWVKEGPNDKSVPVISKIGNVSDLKGLGTTMVIGSIPGLVNTIQTLIATEHKLATVEDLIIKRQGVMNKITKYVIKIEDLKNSLVNGVELIYTEKDILRSSEEWIEHTFETIPRFTHENMVSES